MNNTPQTERQRILDLAQQGDPEIIAALLNHRLRLQNITVEATVQGNCLSLLLDSKTVFNSEELLSFIQTTLNKLHPNMIQTVEINTSSQSSLSWNQRIEINQLPMEERKLESTDDSSTSSDEINSLENLSLQAIFEVEDCQFDDFEDEVSQEIQETEISETFEAPLVTQFDEVKTVEKSEYFETQLAEKSKKIQEVETQLTNLPQVIEEDSQTQLISSSFVPIKTEVKPRVPLTQTIQLDRFPLAQDLSLLKKDLSAWLESSVKILPEQNRTETSRLREEEQEFLRFQLSHQDTAILPVSCIKEILRISETDILPVPHPNDCVLGIHNWRGEMLWMIDLNRFLGFPPLIQGDNRLQTETAIVLKLEEKVLGIVVQQVDDIERHNLQNLQSPSPSLFSAQLRPFVQGCLPETRSIVLDVPAIMTTAVWKQ